MTIVSLEEVIEFMLEDACKWSNAGANDRKSALFAAEAVEGLARKMEKRFRNGPTLDDACRPDICVQPRDEFMRNCERFRNCLEKAASVEEAQSLYSRERRQP